MPPLANVVLLIVGAFLLTSLAGAIILGLGKRRGPATPAELPPLQPIGRRLTPARHALMLEYIQQIRKDVENVTQATKDPHAVGDAAMLYLIVLWLLPVCDELLHDHVVVSPAMTADEEVPKKKLHERYRDMAAGAFGRNKPEGERPV